MQFLEVSRPARLAAWMLVAATLLPMVASASAAQPNATEAMSASARDLLARLRPSVVQIRTFYGANVSEAGHGSGFAVAAGGVLLTNYHVVADAVLYPNQYRMEYHTTDGKVGAISVLAFDIRHDLALVHAAGIDLVPLALRADVPPRGERAYSLGYPLDLGLVITEGVVNGRVDDAVEPHLYYSGALNPGVSGGPTVDSSGRVVGVNAFGAGGELLNFLVPIEFAMPLLDQRGHAPLDPHQLRDIIAQQVKAHMSSMLGAIPAPLATQRVSGYALPARLAGFFTCNAGGDTDMHEPVHSQSMACQTHAALYLEEGLNSGDLRFRHYLLSTDQLGAMRFARRLSQAVVAYGNRGSGTPRHVTPYACRRDSVALQTFDAVVRVCARGYRQYPGLYDLNVTAVSQNRPRSAVVTSLAVTGVEYSTGIEFVRKFLGALQWSP
ncbi:MAG TPA: S1C family serine protease [Steroidobacteraceae bacterium]|nr:S1C family serine protease [Steroidobacteraceae bacterium]